MTDCPAATRCILPTRMLVTAASTCTNNRTRQAPTLLSTRSDTQQLTTGPSPQHNNSHACTAVTHACRPSPPACVPVRLTRQHSNCTHCDCILPCGTSRCWWACSVMQPHSLSTILALHCEACSKSERSMKTGNKGAARCTRHRPSPSEN
jgi:hypothetical protein